MQTLDDGLAVRREIEQHRPARAVIVGAGCLGLDMAEALCALGIEAHLVEAGGRRASTSERPRLARGVRDRDGDGRVDDPRGAAKRIDAFALALWNEMAVGDLQNVDLSYPPPFAPAWDPVLIAARKADEQVRQGP